MAWQIRVYYKAHLPYTMLSQKGLCSEQCIWRLLPLPANTNSNYGSVRQALALKQDFGHEIEKSLQLGLNCSLKQWVLPLLFIPTQCALKGSEGSALFIILMLHWGQERSDNFHCSYSLFPPSPLTSSSPHTQHLAFPKKAGKHIEQSSDSWTGYVENILIV